MGKKPKQNRKPNTIYNKIKHRKNYLIFGFRGNFAPVGGHSQLDSLLILVRSAFIPHIAVCSWNVSQEFFWHHHKFPLWWTRVTDCERFVNFERINCTKEFCACKAVKWCREWAHKSPFIHRQIKNLKKINIVLKNIIVCN